MPDVIGPYRVVAKLGEGGMGEVYRARDTKLNREVAIKILPEGLANDPDRVARFEREAQMLATLNHPNIGAIYGLEDVPSAGSGPAGAVHALVLELVEGPTLADQIAQGPIPFDEALPIARQICSALEAAHDHGVIHRDLKPANIKVRPDGTVKVLDFGLAKALEPTVGPGLSALGESRAQLSQSPTLTSPALMTGAHVILGTAAYMSPEQAKGKPLDKRTDIWAFGAVLFEMLTGRKAFDGEDVTDTIALVVRGEPDWSALPPDLSPQLRLLLKRSLEKDRGARLSDIGTVRFLLTEALPPAPVVAVASMASERVVRRRMLMSASTALIAGAAVAAAAAWALTRPAPLPELQPVRFSVIPTAAQPLTSTAADRQLAISPDGTHLVYVAGGDSQLLVRSIDQLEAVPLRGITGARSPFFSPDGTWIGFFQGATELKKVSITGGPAITLCRAAAPRGASWGSDGAIVFATSDRDTGLLSVPEGGGDAKTLTKPDASGGEVDHLLPTVLPGGQAILFTITAPGPIDNAQVAVLDLKTGQRKTLIRGGSHAEYVEPGYLVYAVAGTLRAVRFDPVGLEVLSDPVPVVEQLTMVGSGAAEYSVSRNGTLAYVPGSAGDGTLRSLVWVNRQGQEEPLKGPQRAYESPRISPDGTRIAVAIRDQENDIWVWDVVRTTLTRLTFDPARDFYPIWMPDGKAIVFASFRSGVANGFRQQANGTGVVEQLTTTGPNNQIPVAINPDGQQLVVLEQAPKTSNDLMLLRLSPGRPPSKLEPLIQTMFSEVDAEISPDGHWIAYPSNESGQNQIYVRPFPDVNGGRWQVSAGGGTRPAWVQNGKELIYGALDGAITAVPVNTTGPTFNFGNPTKLFDWKTLALHSGRTYDVSVDGQKFLMVKEAGSDQSAASASNIVVVLNWVEELKQRMSVK